MTWRVFGTMARGVTLLAMIVTLACGMCWNPAADSHEHHDDESESHLCFSCICHQVIPPAPITVGGAQGESDVIWCPHEAVVADDFIADIDPPPVKRT
jgi:hypothetical protein